MPRQVVSQRFGCALVEENAYLGKRQGASCSVIEDRADLLECDAGKPLDKLRRRRAVFQVLKQGGHRNPCPAEYPGATHAFWAPLDRGA